jgi:hypothetical protein
VVGADSAVAADLAGLVEAVPAEEARAAIGKSHAQRHLWKQKNRSTNWWNGLNPWRGRT